jgi:hypothetical protein
VDLPTQLVLQAAGNRKCEAGYIEPSGIHVQMKPCPPLRKNDQRTLKGVCLKQSGSHCACPRRTIYASDSGRLLRVRPQLDPILVFFRVLFAPVYSVSRPASLSHATGTPAYACWTIVDGILILLVPVGFAQLVHFDGRFWV